MVSSTGRVSGNDVPMESGSIFRINKGQGKTKIFHVQTARYIRVLNGATVDTTTDSKLATEFHLDFLQGRADMGKMVLTRIMGEQSDNKLPDVPPHRDCKLTREQTIFFRDNGYVVLRNAISEEIVSDALRVI